MLIIDIIACIRRMKSISCLVLVVGWGLLYCVMLCYDENLNKRESKQESEGRKRKRVVYES